MEIVKVKIPQNSANDFIMKILTVSLGSQSKVFYVKDGDRINAKSIMYMSHIKAGSIYDLEIAGEDEESCAREIRKIASLGLCLEE